MQCRVPGFPAQRRPLAPGAAATEAPPALAPLQQLNGGAVPLVRFGFPKGSLQKSTEELFARAGYQVSLQLQALWRLWLVRGAWRLAALDWASRRSSLLACIAFP